jgi:hypothetical protein
MREKYRGLVIASKVLRVVAIVVVVVGIVVILASFIDYGVSGFGWGNVAVILYILGFLLAGVLIYSFCEVIKLLINIETEIRDKITGKE